MKVLIVGGGGREHAMGYKVSQSNRVAEIFFAPGNAGTATLGKNLPLAVTDIEALKKFALEQKIDLTLVGPELPLSLGIVDSFRQAGLAIFGPDKNAAQLETSKAFSKQFMRKHGIDTGDYAVFSDANLALEYLENATYPIVIKADGLALGKGVVICENKSEAQQAIDEMMTQKVFGDSGSQVVIEEFLVGKEVSLLCFTDGKTIVPMESASDYKRAFDNDEGLNTGGMGSISPSFYYQNGSCNYIAEQTLKGIQTEGFDYRGVVYIGLMMTEKGPKVLEYNVRFGDPETQALLLRLDTDLVDIAEYAIAQKLTDINIQWNHQPAVAVVVAAEGYPGDYIKDSPIHLPTINNDDMVVFHSATRNDGQQLLSVGGRVLTVCSKASTMEQARAQCYRYLAQIDFPHSFYRKDIGA